MKQLHIKLIETLDPNCDTGYRVKVNFTFTHPCIRFLEFYTDWGPFNKARKIEGFTDPYALSSEQYTISDLYVKEMYEKGII